MSIYRRIHRIHHGSTYEAACFLDRPHPELGGATPYQVLSDGDPALVEALLSELEQAQRQACGRVARG